MNQKEMAKEFASQNVEREQQLEELIEKVESLDEKMEAQKTARQEQHEKVIDALNGVAEHLKDLKTGGTSSASAAERMLEAAEAKEERVDRRIEDLKQERARLEKAARSTADHAQALETTGEELVETPDKVEKTIHEATAATRRAASLLTLKIGAVVVLVGVLSAVTVSLWIV
jgi:chromosome segregation ATPase